MEPNTATPTEHAVAEASAPARGSGLNRFFGAQAQQKLLAFLSLIVMFIFFSFASPYFAQMDNVLAIMQATAVDGVLGISATFVIITAGIDLSVGTLMTFCAVMTGVVLTNWGMPLWLGVLASIATGAFCGAVSGFLIAKLKIPPFIATLGMMWAVKGLSLVVTSARPIYFNDTPNFDMISQASLIGYFVPSVPIPNGVLILFGLAIVASVILNRTALGRYTFALGSNEEAARLSGVNVDAWKIAVYCPGRSDHRHRRPDHRLTPQLGPARARAGLRARGDRRRGYRRHFAGRRLGNHPRHDHWRLHHERAAQRPAHHVGLTGMADCRDRRHHHSRCLRRHPAPKARVRR